MDENNVVNEVLSNETSAEQESEYVVIYDELLEQIYGEMQTQTELLAEIKKEEQSLLEMAVESYKEHVGARCALGVILAFYVISFCWSCIRQWRKKILGMGE